MTQSVFRMVDAKPRKLSKANKLAINKAAEQMLVQEIEELEQRAHRLGLLITARGLNNAKNAAGWELAGNTDRASKATRGER